MKYPFTQRTRKPIALAAAVLAAALLTPASRAFGADTPSCSANPANRALDFWLGEWTIAAPGGGPNATSKVTLDLDQCLVVERWDGGRGHRGENFFAYSADDQSWHGLFADNEGRVHVFLHGEAAPGSVSFNGPSRGPDSKTVLNRVIIRRAGDNRVEQVWQKSSDDGRTWTTAFGGDYKRKP